MRKILFLTNIVTFKCLESKFIKKNEFFIIDCNSNLDFVEFKRLNQECDESEFIEEDCKPVEGESY